MQINAANGSSSNTSDPAATNQLTGDTFMKLLLAQLKSQDPLSPMDPTQFVGQMVQFNTLEQIIGIRQDLEKTATNAAATAVPNKITGAL